MIELSHIYKAYDGRPVLTDFSYRFSAHGAVAVMGRSGGGKTTLLRIMLGLTLPDSGTIEAPVRMGAVFQEDRLIERMSVRENLRLVCADTPAVDRHVERIGLSEFLNVPVARLSGGMRRRVALSRGVLFPCDALLLDEPFKGLDEEMRKSMIRYLQKECAGRLLVLVTHDRTEAAEIGAREIIEIGG